MTLDVFLSRLNKVNLIAHFSAAIEAESDNILDRNRQQMFSGMRSDGSEISPPYTPLTKFLKAQKGQPFDRVTLNDTGSFYRLMFLTVRNGAFIIDSRDDKSEELQTKYGETIFGVNQQNINDLAPDIGNRVVNDVARDLGV